MYVKPHATKQPVVTPGLSSLFPPLAASLHSVDFRIFGPLPEGFAEEPENDSCQTPEDDQAHVRHDGRYVAALDDPWGDELRESVTPDVLVDRDGNEN